MECLLQCMVIPDQVSSVDGLFRRYRGLEPPKTPLMIYSACVHVWMPWRVLITMEKPDILVPS